MATYLDMQERIINELQRTDLAGGVVQDAIQDAIKHFHDEALWASEATTTSVTVDGTRAYDTPTDFVTMVALHVTDDAGFNLPVVGITFQELDELDSESPSSTDLPTKYAIFNDQIHLWPTPNDAYTLTWYYNSNLAAPDDDTDEGFWMNEAARMIRCFAKGILFSDVLYKEEWAQVEFAKAQAEFARLVQTSEGKAFESGVRAWG